MSWTRKPRSAGAAAGAAELAALLREQEREVSLIRELSATVTAPPELRARLAAERQRERRRPRRPVLATAVAAAAVLALVLLLALPESEGGPTVAEAATVAQRGATSPAPAPGRPKLLARDVGGVAFPAWERAFGWRTAGQRADNLDGRRTATVYYAKDGRRIGYTIVDGAPLPALQAATSVRRAGTVFGTFHTGGRVVVTWLRGGRTCVLSGSGVPRRTLLKLAAWRGGGAVAF